MSALIEVKWNRKKFPVEFDSARDLEQTTVGELKEHCQRITHVNPDTFKLQAFGVTMSNNDMPLGVYGVRPGCSITLKPISNHHHSKSNDSKVKGQEHHHQHTQSTALPEKHEHKKNESHKKSSQEPQQQQQNHTSSQAQPEQGKASQPNETLLDKLQVIEKKIDNEIALQVEKYKKDVRDFMSKSGRTEKDKKKQVYMGAYLNEQLMRVLLDLDALSCGSDLNARQKRKESVEKAQELCDKVDEVKTVVKSAAVVDG